MPTYFANPLGFLALLGVPAVLAIHFLREKSRRVQASTLFLLERLAPRTPRGRTLHFLQNSPALWLQLLIVCLCTWLLVQPRWVRSDSVQQAVVILDNSASMSAFRDRVMKTLPRGLEQVGAASARTQWTFVTSDRPETPLYRGAELGQALSALGGWHPAMPSHDPARAFSIGLLEARGGTVLYVTDRRPETVPAGVTPLTFGRPIPNCGFAGVKVWNDADGARWEALVKNSSDTPQEREWWMESETVRSQPQRLRLEPGQIATIPGPFPPGERRVTVRLTPDQFTLDDVLPVVASEPKAFSIFVGAEGAADFLQRVMATLPGVKKTPDSATADLQVFPAVADPASMQKAAIWFAAGASPEPKADLDAVTPDNHPLMQGLVWDGLLGPGPREFALEPSDRGLLWQSDRPLLVLRKRGEADQLIVNFDFANSNAGRLPAFILLVSRFVADVQDRKPAFFADNFETHQTLPLPGVKGAVLSPDHGKEEPRSDGAALRAPTEPGTFVVRSGNAEMLRGGAHFGDPREADFRDANESAGAMLAGNRVRRENTVGDRFATGWLLLIGAALAGSWIAQNRSATEGGLTA